ncbi:MAG: hypothetical protein JWO67_4830 [Streptosporangiaceae bacterium]|nr:hypothetical protein [Streptosporangiaceae bacterium]
MAPTEEAPDPFWDTDLGRRTALRNEVRDLINSFAPQPEMEEKPAGHFAGPDVPEHEVAEYLHRHGIYSTPHRTEH